jgi:hypothetical protein
VAKFERFFRISAGLDIDKQDLKRYADFIDQKIYDLLLRRGDGQRPGLHRGVRPPDNHQRLTGEHPRIQEV